MTDQTTVSPILDHGDESEKTRKDFPVLGFILRHPFELLAVAITFIGVLGYAAGKSFADGWNRTAGIPSSLFPTDPYESVLRGLSLESPWLYSAIGLASILVYIWILSIFSARQDQQNTLVRVRRKSYETRADRRKRYELAIAARAEKTKDLAFHAWKNLGPRGRWRDIQDARRAKAARNNRYLKLTGYLALQLMCIFFLGFGYWAIKLLVIKEANVAGVKDYIGIYAAVTGTLPPQFDPKSISSERLKSFACIGNNELWKYRSVYLENQKADISPSPGKPSYVLQGTDKVFLFLSPSGSTIQSFGGVSFTLVETKSRSLSALVKSCP